MIPVPRFLVFGLDRFYPSGGWSDFEAAFETQQEANDYVAAWMQRDPFAADQPRRDEYRIADLADPATLRPRRGLPVQEGGAQ